MRDPFSEIEIVENESDDMNYIFNKIHMSTTITHILWLKVTCEL
jgi:hypothetical protein